MSKEELDPYEKEVKGAIDEYNKRLKQKDTYESGLKKAKEEETKRIEDKKVEEDEGGFFDEGSAFRTTAAIGTEIAANTLLDLFSFIPPAQYAGGAAINYLAQRIRGGEFSQGEMIAAGLASLLPGGAQAKSLGGVIGKGVARGALSGAIETGAADLIDTGEIDAERLGQGALIGGAFGGIFSHAGSQKSVKRGIKYFQDRIRGEKFVKLSPEDALELGLGEPMMSVQPGGKSTQYRLLFNWESQGAKPKANIGDTVDIVPRKVLRNKNWVTRKNIKFTKPDSINLTNGFIPTKQHKNFSEFIEDLIEADRIPARNITPQGFKAVGARSATPDLDLYEDYIAGYFNTYNTLDGITKVTLNNKTLRLGGKSLDNLKDVERILKAYKLNPKAFTSGAFNPNSSTSKDIIEAFAQSKDIDDFIVKNLQLQRHHIAILDDSFALVDGLTGNDLDRMYKIMDTEGLIVGNDARNLQLLPQEFHQGFIHGTIWPIAGPNWTGTTNTARLMRKNIAKLPSDQRVKYVQQLKDAIDEINLFMDDIIDTYIKEVKKGGQITLQDKASFMRYARRYMSKKGLLDTFDVDETIRSTSKFRRPDLEDQEFGQGRMQDDLQ